MTIPSVMFIEMALDSLKYLVAEKPGWSPLVDGGPLTTTIDREVHEFRMLGMKRIDDARKLIEPLSDAELGYLIGIETARIILQQTPDAVMAKITL